MDDFNVHNGTENYHRRAGADFHPHETRRSERHSNVYSRRFQDELLCRGNNRTAFHVDSRQIDNCHGLSACQPKSHEHSQPKRTDAFCSVLAANLTPAGYGSTATHRATSRYPSGQPYFTNAGRPCACHYVYSDNFASAGFNSTGTNHARFQYQHPACSVPASAS